MVQKFSGGERAGLPTPGPNADATYTTDGVFDAKVRRVFSDGGVCVPAHGGPYYLSMPAGDLFAPAGPGGQKVAVSVCLADDARPFATLNDVDGAEGADLALLDNFTLDQWLHLIPAAKLLVSIPKTNDKLVVRRFDAEAELAKSGLAYVVVTSHPPEAARQGEEFVYPLDVKTNMAGLTYRLEDGPPGRAIDVAGRLTWKVPADQAGGPVEVAVSVSRPDDDRRCVQSFTVGVIAGGGRKGQRV